MGAGLEPAVLTNTFSIVARALDQGEFGIAVSTCVPAVGAVVPFVSLCGAIATQSYTNVDLGAKGLELLAVGLPVDKALALLLEEDEGRDIRQVHGMDAWGNAFAHTGADCVEWCGHLVGRHHTVAGNMLVGKETIQAMSASFEASDPEVELAERLLCALEAGQKAGGDKRGKESSALLVASPNPERYHNLRVDLHHDPVAELRRVFDVSRDRAVESRKTYGQLKTQPKIKW